MAKYAIRIQGEAKDLLAVLNGGVEPAVEETSTFLIVDTDSDASNEIVSEDDLLNKFEAVWSTTIWYVE